MGPAGGGLCSRRRDGVHAGGSGCPLCHDPPRPELRPRDTVAPARLRTDGAAMGMGNGGVSRRCGRAGSTSVAGRAVLRTSYWRRDSGQASAAGSLPSAFRATFDVTVVLQTARCLMRQRRLSRLSLPNSRTALCCCRKHAARWSADCWQETTVPRGESPCCLWLAASSSPYGWSSLCGSAGVGASVAAAEHQPLRRGVSSSIHHSDTSSRSGNANSSSETTPNPVHRRAPLTSIRARRLSVRCGAPRAGTTHPKGCPVIPGGRTTTAAAPRCQDRRSASVAVTGQVCRHGP